MSRPVAPLALAILFASGCNTSDYDAFVTPSYTSNAMGRLTGTMPTAGAVDAELTEASIEISHTEVYIDAHVLDENWAMLRGDFRLESGEDDTFVAHGPTDHDVLGCSGPDRYVNDFDDHAESIQVVRRTVFIDEIEAYELTITANFTEGFDVTAVLVQPKPRGED